MKSVASSTRYDLFDLPPTATQAEIRAAHRRLIWNVHPDHGGSHALFRQVQEAYELLSDPVKRAAYDRSLKNPPHGTAAGPRAHADTGWERGCEWPPPPPGAGTSNAWRPPPPRAAGTSGPYPPPRSSEAAAAAQSATSGGGSGGSWLGRHPTAAVIVAAYLVLILGAGLGSSGSGLIVVGFLAIIVAVVAVLGARRVSEREAYQRAGMPTVDAMSGTQFGIILKYLFAQNGYRVARVGGRGDFDADLLLDSPEGRTVVQAKRWTGLVRHDAVQEAVAAKAHYGATHAMVVTSSYFSQHAINLARSNNVKLWDRAIVAHELAVFRSTPMLSPVHRFGSQLRAGIPVLASGLWTVLVVLAASSGDTKRRRRRTSPRRGSVRRRR
jgi:restriction system protein